MANSTIIHAWTKLTYHMISLHLGILDGKTALCLWAILNSTIKNKKANNAKQM